MRSAQNGSNPDGSRRRQVPVDDPKRSSYQGETNRRSPPSLQRSRFPSSPEPAHGNGLMVPFDRPGSVSSEHDSFATPPTSMPNSRETSPTSVPDRAEPTAKPSQRVQPFPNQGYRRPGQDDSQTASDTQDIAPASSGSSSPKIWHVNPLQQSSERKKSRSPSSRGKVGNKAKLVQVPSSATQNTDHPRVQSPSSRQEHPLVRQGSLPGRFEQQNSSQSQPVPYTPPPQLKHQQSNQRMGSPVQRSRGVLTRHFSSDNAVSLAQAPPSPQHTARGRHYSVGDHRSAFSPPDRKQQLTKQLSLQEDLVHYENGERYRYPDIKSRNQPPPPPPQRSSSHVWSRQISGHPWSPPPQCLSPDFFHSHLAKDAMTSVSQPAGLPLTHSASQPSFAQDGLTYSQPVQSPALQQAQPPSSPSQQGFVPPNLYAMHPNQQLYYQLQQQHQQHHQQPQLQPAPMYYAKQQSLPLVQTEEGQIQQVYQGYATQPQSDQFPPEQAPLLQEGIYQQRERDPSNSPPQGYNYPSDTAHSSTSSSRYDSETIAANERRPLLSNYTCNSTSTTTTTTTTSPDPNNDTLFYLVTKDSRSEVKQRPPYRSSREEMTQQPRESQNDYVPARGPEEDDAFYINSDALLKDERVRRGRSPGRNDPAWEDHIRRRERRRDELIRSSSQEREERQPQGQRASSSEKVTNSEQEYTSVPASPRRKSRHSRSGSQSPQGQRSSRNQRHESPSPRPKSKVSGSKEKLARSKSSEIPEYANVPLQKKYKSKRKEKQSDEEPVYANVPIKGDKRRQRSNSSPSSITRQLEVPPDEPPEYVNVPLRYDRISKSAANWKEQYVLEYVQKSSDPDLVKRRPPASPKKPERESPVPRRAQESLVQKKKTDSLHKDSSLKERSLSPPTRRADSPRFSPRRKSDESRPWHKRRQSPSPVRRERPRSFEGDQEDRQVDDLQHQRPKSVHEELLMPGVVPAAIEYLRTRRGRGSVRSIQEHHPRSQSVGRVERSHNDLCYSTSNLEHYARDTTDIRDTLPRSWGMEMFARRRRDPELFPDSLELHTRDGFTNQAYIPDTLGRHGSESQERSRLRRHGSYEDALELGLISTSSSSPERPPKSPTKLGGNDSQLYYVYGTEQNIPNVLSNYYGKKPARHRRSEDFERALQELDDMYAKLNLETDDLYRPSRSDGYRRTKSTEIPLHSVPRIPVGKMHKNEAPSQKAKRRAQRERPHSYTAGLTTSEDSGDQFHLQEKLRQVKSPNKHKAELPKYEKIASKVRYRAPEYDMTSSEDEYNDKQLVRKSKSHAAVFRRPEAYKKGGRSSDSSPSPERVSLRTRSQSADDFVPQPESKVKFQEPPQRPYGKVVIPSDLSISQDDSPPHGRGRVGEKKDNRELEELYNASGLHPRMVWITDSDSMSVQRGSTEQQVSTSELDEEIPRDEGEPIAGNAKTGKPVQGGEPVTGVTGEAAEQSEPKPVYIRNVRVFHRAKVESVEETQEKRKSLLDDPSIPLADGSEGEDEEVKALMQPSFEESKVDKEKTMKGRPI